MNFEINPLIKEFWESKALRFNIFTFNLGGKLNRIQYMGLTNPKPTPQNSQSWTCIADANYYRTDFSNKIYYMDVRYYYENSSYSEEEMLRLIKLKTFI